MLLGKVSESDILAFAEGINWDYSSVELCDEELMWNELKCKLLEVSSNIPTVRPSLREYSTETRENFSVQF